MTDSMQFGPEWLRNLSQHDNENTMVMPKYQLAEHRYGREEMLALFDKTVAAPEPLRSVAGLYIEKVQLPLVLIPMSEEESRVWNSNVNNDGSARGMIKTVSSNVAINATGSGGTGLSRGRGTSVDRGRGRGTRGPYHYNTRNYSEEGAETSHPNTAFGRPRIFDRSQSHNSERGWSERNGNVAEYSDWNGYNNTAENGLSTSPRKDFGTSMRLASSREDTNWRRRPAKDEDDSWRSSRHGRGYTNWREGGERDREKEKETENPEPGKDRRWMSRVVNMHSQSNRRNSEGKDDNLPEWATENPSEGGGTFDSSGAFHGTNSEDDEPVIEKKTKEKSKSEPDKSSKKKEAANPPDDASERNSRTERKPSPNEQKKNRTKESSSSVTKNTAQKARESPHNSVDFVESFSPTCNKDATTESNFPPQGSLKQHHQQQQARNSSPQVSEEYFSIQTDSKDAKIDVGSRTSSQQAQQKQKPQHELQMYSQLQQKLEYSSSNSNTSVSQSMDGAELRTLLENAYRNPAAAAYRNTSNNGGSVLENKLLISPSDIVNNSIPLMNQKDSLEKSKPASTVNTLTNLHHFNMPPNIQSKGKEEELDGIVGDVVSKIMEEEEKAEKLKKLDGINKWYYRDPQGIVQGPFLSTEMAEWYRLGYFHDKTLMVRRASESNYYPLHELVSFFGGTPFENVTLQNINSYARLPIASVPLNVVPNTMPPPPVNPNVPDEAFLQQHYRSSYDLMYVRQQQVLAAKKRQLAQTTDGMKTLFEQQRLLSQRLASGPDANAASAQPSIPMIPGYMHPIIPPTLPSTNPNLVILLNQLQQQQHQQQQHQQQHQHQLQQQLLHQHVQQQQQQQQPPSQPQQTKDVKQERSQQPPMMPHSEHPLQQLVHKMSGLSTSNLMPLVQAQAASMYPVVPTLSSESVSQSESPSSIGNKETQPTNPIANLLKQLSGISDKDSKVDSVWGPSNVPSVPLLSSSTFNAQRWCSQVGRIGPSNSVANNGLWTSEGIPTTTTMKTEQQIIQESLMSMNQRKLDESTNELDNSEPVKRLKKQQKALRLQEEELLRRTAEEVKKKEVLEMKLEEEKKAKREEEKRKKRQDEEDRLRRIEEEQRRKSVEDAKRKEEDRRRKEEEKRKKEEERELKRKSEEEKKKQELKRKETEEQQTMKDLEKLQRKQLDAMRRLKEQQASASANNKPSLKTMSTLVQEKDLPQQALKIQKPNVAGGKQLSKSSSGQVEEQRKPNAEPSVAGNKQIAKSKSTPSVPTQGQKTGDVEKKEKKKKEKNGATNAWADQKKITNVKSLAEIQAEEQKQLAKQIEKDKQERLLQQQQQAAAAQAAKESNTGNIWNSQNQPWKTNSWPSNASSSSPSFANRSDVSVASKAASITITAGNRSQSNTAAAAGTSGFSKNAPANEKVLIKQVSGGPTSISGTATNAKMKGKKEEPTNKKSSTALTQAVLKNDELSKWGVKVLSSLKPSVDVPTFIAFLREVESPTDVKEYVTDYLGDSKEIKNFVKQFLDRRSGVTPNPGVAVFSSTTVVSTATSVANAKKSKKKLEEGASIMKMPAKQPLAKTNSLEFTEVKGKTKKNKKKPVLRVDSALLGFNVTAAPDRFNVGDRDYGEDVY